MKKSLFLQSMSHLQKKSLEEEVLVNEVVEQPPNLIAETKKIPYAIYLGKGVSFLNPQDAYDFLLQEEEKPLPGKYRNSLTKAFFNGTETGQINSLYKDWKKYKKGIFPKISAFFLYIKNESEKCPVCKKYASYVISGLTPANEETFENGVVDLFFFKFWVLFKFYVEKGNR
jgi:hypothetical protein